MVRFSVIWREQPEPGIHLFESVSLKASIDADSLSLSSVVVSSCATQPWSSSVSVVFPYAALALTFPSSSLPLSANYECLGVDGIRWSLPRWLLLFLPSLSLHCHCRFQCCYNFLYSGKSLLAGEGLDALCRRPVLQGFYSTSHSSKSDCDPFSCNENTFSTLYQRLFGLFQSAFLQFFS